MIDVGQVLVFQDLSKGRSAVHEITDLSDLRTAINYMVSMCVTVDFECFHKTWRIRYLFELEQKGEWVERRKKARL